MKLPLLRADINTPIYSTATPEDEFEQRPCIDCGQPALNEESLCWSCEAENSVTEDLKVLLPIKRNKHQ